MRHLSDHELLLFADGELSHRRRSKVSAHVDSCSACRCRLSKLEATMAGFVEFHGQTQLPSAEGPAALLKARLSASHAAPKGGMVANYAVLLALLAAAVFFTSRHWSTVEAASVPRTDLTPGAITAITAGESCRAEGAHFNREVPVALQQAVFREYGIRDPWPRNYEVDYLITPELGGASDIRNLWPEPYFTSVWNAHVKDALEDRLHQLVCSGQLDLATAQHDLSTNWIAAYKKYFHTNLPARAY